MGLLVLMNGPMGHGLSGGDVHAGRLLRAWAERFDAGVVLCAPSGVFERLVPMPPASARPISTSRSPRTGSGVLAYLAALATRMVVSVCRAPTSRVVVASSHLFHDVIPGVALRLRKGSHLVVYVYHLVEEERPSKTARVFASVALERVSVWLLARYATVVFVDREELVSSLAARGVPRAALVLTGNAYDPVDPPASPAVPERPVVLFCGRLVRQKGVWDVLRLAERLLVAHPDIDVMLVGDGPERAALERAAEERGLTNVQVRGFVCELDKWELLLRATVLVAPSVEEGWGIAVGEALWAGTPVVAYDLPAYHHFGMALTRVPVGDTDTFLQAVLRLLGDPRCLAAAETAARDATLPVWATILDAEIKGILERCT